jgi:hypothetical protein
MSVLTRIKNNQITDSTILANTKIVPGSIVGSLFNTNLTMTSDVTITGNLTVQGSSTYLTVASTNTYVNDPLIILNNAFSGTNTYDVGLLFNRGNQATSALIWNEANDEFRLQFTTDDGTGYGAINNSGYANVRVGNVTVQYDAGVRNLSASGSVDATGNVSAAGIVISGDLAVNGGDLTTSATTFNLLAAPTTLNVGAAATSLVLGATSGTLNLRNANIYMPNATTLFSGQSTVALLNENVTTLNVGQAATTLTVGATSGTLSLRNANVWLPNATTLDGAQATVGLFNLATTVDAFKAATDIEIGATTGTLTINNPAVVGTQTTQNLYNTTATTLNFAGAATTLTIAAASGTTQIRNNLDVDLSLNARDIQSTVIGNVTPAAATFTALTSQGTTQLGLTTATAINNTPIGNATPATATFTELTTNSTTNLSLTTATAINNTPIGNATPSTGAFTTLTGANLSATGSANLTTSGTVTVNPAVAGSIDNVAIGATTPGTGKFTTLQTTSVANIGALTAASINGTVIGNVTPAAATFTALTTNSTTNLSLTTATAINNTPIGNATASTGAFTTLTSSGITEVTNATEATGAGTGAFRVTGGASVGGNLYVSGNINITGSSFVLTGNSGVFYGDTNGFGALYAGTTGYTPLPYTVVQTSANYNGYVQNNFENQSTGNQATTDWVATAGDGSDVDHYIDMGITTANWDGTQDNSLTNAVGANDGYLYVQGNITTGQGGNLTVGASAPGTRQVKIIVGGNTASNITAVFSNPGTASSSKTTGALTIAGGVGLTGNLNADGIDASSDIATTSITPSTSTTTGALRVGGGAGIAGNVWIGANLNVAGDLVVQGNVVSLNTSTLDVEDLNITVAKGAADSAAANGAGLTVDGAGATILYTHATTSWNLNKHLIGTSAQFSSTLGVTGATTLTDDLAVNGGDITTTATTFNLLNTNATTLNVGGAATTLNLGATSGTTTVKNNLTTDLTLTARDLNATVIGNVSPAAGSFTALNGSTLVLTSTANVGALTAASINGTVIGNVTAAAATFTSLTSQSTTTLGAVSAASINSTVIGNVTPASGAFTTLTGANLSATWSANLTTVGAVTLNSGTTGSIDGINIGATTSGTGKFTTLQSTSTANVGALTAASINGTVIGNVTPAAATFTSLTSQSTTTLGAVTAASINSTVIGNTTAAAGTFTTLTGTDLIAIGSANLTTTGAITLSSGTTGSIDGVNIGATTAGTGKFTTLQSTSTANVGALTAASINGTVIGNVTPAAASFTTLVSSSTANVGALTAASINGTVIGNVTPASGDFTRLAATGIVYANATTASTSYSTGGLVALGGVGVAGNLNVASNKSITVGLDLASNVKYPDSVIETYTSSNVSSAISIRNLSTGIAASSNFVALADNGSNVANNITVGIAGSAYDQGLAIKANDGYVLSASGNLLLSAGAGDVKFTAGGLTDSDIIAKFSATGSNFQILADAISTSTTSGALTVVGGAGFGSNIWVANGAVINDSQTSDNFVVKGKLASSLIVANSNYGAVVIGGSNASPQLGATLKINSSDALMIPVGATADRPSNSGNVDVQGMIRFNTTNSSLEFYTGTDWASAGGDTTFTIITNQQFTGDGANVNYTLSGNTTTNGCMVSINGVVQIPTYSYSVTGSLLTFTEAPATGDLIDVRVFTLTQTVGDVTSVNGLNAFTPDNANGAAIYSGTVSSGSIERAAARTDGTWAFVNGTKTTYDQAVTNTSTTTTVIDLYPVASYSSAKYIVQVKNGANIETMEALLVSTSSDAYLTTYGVVNAGYTLGTLSANVVSGNVKLYYTSAVTNSNVKVYTTYIV